MPGCNMYNTPLKGQKYSLTILELFLLQKEILPGIMLSNYLAGMCHLFAKRNFGNNFLVIGSRCP